MTKKTYIENPDVKDRKFLLELYPNTASYIQNLVYLDYPIEELKNSTRIIEMCSMFFKEISEEDYIECMLKQIKDHIADVFSMSVYVNNQFYPFFKFRLGQFAMPIFRDIFLVLQDVYLAKLMNRDNVLNNETEMNNDQ